jgi:hypothetical protein
MRPLALLALAGAAYLAWRWASAPAMPSIALPRPTYVPGADRNSLSEALGRSGFFDASYPTREAAVAASEGGSRNLTVVRRDDGRWIVVPFGSDLHRRYAIDA